MTNSTGIREPMALTCLARDPRRRSKAGPANEAVVSTSKRRYTRRSSRKKRGADAAGAAPLYIRLNRPALAEVD